MVTSRLHLALGPLLAIVFCAVVGDDSSPDQVLKRLGVKRFGSGYILAAETTVRTKLNEARLVQRRLDSAIRKQRDLEQFTQNVEAERRQLIDERLVLNRQLAAGGDGLSVQEHNRFVAMINERSDRLRQLDAQTPDARTVRQIDEQTVQCREAFIQATLDLRKLVDQTNQQYIDRAKDDAFQKSLAAIQSKSKSPVKLGPSADFNKDVKQLQAFEKLVLTDTVPVEKRGGVYEVQVTLNDSVTLPFVYDTGASLVTISSDVAARLGIHIGPDDPTIRLEVANGAIIEAKQKTIPALRVGRFTVNDVTCAVMPPGNAKIRLLLGQSFLHQFVVSGSPDSGKLVMSRVGGQDVRPKRPERKKAVNQGRRGVR